MQHHTGPHHQPRAERGFTLIEIMIAVAIVAILVAVALPSFQDSLRKSRRTDAFTALTAVQQAQERWRGNNATYTTTLSNLPGITTPTPGGRYTLALAAAPASAPLNGAYTATATAQNAQADDTRCKLLGVMVKGGDLTFASGTSSVDFAASAPDANRCWAR